MENLSYTFVTSLDEAESALTSDVFLISLLSSDSHYLSKKLPYSKLCSLILIDVDSKIDDRLDEVISELSTKVDISIEDIRFLSNLIDNCITAIVKIANCVLVNKADIKYLSSILSDNNIANIQYTNGLSSYKAGRFRYVGHSSKKTTNGKALGFLKVGYDEYGHISSSANVSKTDITALGIPGQDTTYTSATTSKLGLVKLNATDFRETDRYRLSLDVNANAFVDVPVESKIANAVQPADEDKLGVVALCANILAAAARIPGFEDKAALMLPLRMLAGKYAYVEVPLQESGTTAGSGTKSASDNTYAITSISYSGGNITGIGSSTHVYDLLYDVSCDVENSCLKDTNTTLNVDRDGSESKLQLLRDGELVSEIDSSDLLDNIGEINVLASVVLSYLVGEDPDDIKKRPAIEVKTTVNGIELLKHGTIPYEDWIFTLDDGSNVTKRVTIHRSLAGTSISY